MKITDIIWLKEIVEKLLWKHDVSQAEAKHVLFNPKKIRFVERGRHAGEDVYSAYGQTEAGRYLVVFFVYKKGGSALVISARDMTIKERRTYEKK